jgi:ethanolamine utilization protein EutQ (cupin superfamily)
MSHIQVFDPETAELLDYPFGSLGSVRSWQPVGADEAASLGAGICEYRGVFDWDLHYDAVYFLLSGSLTVVDQDGEHTVRAGQIMSIPKGSVGHYVSPDGCRLFWAICPGDWERISDFSVNEPLGD